MLAGKDQQLEQRPALSAPKSQDVALEACQINELKSSIIQGNQVMSKPVQAPKPEDKLRSETKELTKIEAFPSNDE